MVQILMSQIGTEYYGFNIRDLRAVIPKRDLINLAMENNPYVIGAILMYGDYIPVYDIHRKLQTAPQDILDYMIIVSFRDRLFAFYADEIGKIIEIPFNEVQPIPVIFADEKFQYVEKVVHFDSKVILMLSLQKLFKEV